MNPLLKKLVPASLRERLRPWREPGRQLRLLQYDRFYSGGVVRRDGLSYKLHTREEVSRHIYTDGHFASDELMFLKTAAPHFRTFIDIGANIGSVTVPFAAGCSLPAIAIEPVESNFALLTENLRLNGLESRVVTRRVALGDCNGTVDMFLSEENRGDHRAGSYAGGDRKRETVELSKLPDCVARVSGAAAPFLIKMDVQGFEGKVLAGAGEFLRSHECLLLTEFWPEGLRGNGCEPRDFFALLAGAGLAVYEVKRPPALKPVRTAAELEAVAATLSGEGYCNLVATNRPLDRAGLQSLLAR